jgi:hypothetical protein
MSAECKLDESDIVLNLNDPSFTADMARLWKGVGVANDVVETQFPATKSLDDHEYYSHAANNTTQHYSCHTLALALKILDTDYEGQYKKWFPLPAWAIKVQRECGTGNPE